MGPGVGGGNRANRQRTKVLYYTEEEDIWPYITIIFRIIGTRVGICVFVHI